MTRKTGHWTRRYMETDKQERHMESDKHEMKMNKNDRELEKKERADGQEGH